MSKKGGHAEHSEASRVLMSGYKSYYRERNASL
jgi:hypothetical protein